MANIIFFPLSIQAFISLIASISIFLIFKRRKITSKLPLPPGPKPWPIIGSIHLMLKNKPFYHWIHDTMSKMGVEIFCIRLGNVHVITVTSPEIACEFFKKQDAVFASRPIVMSAEVVSGGFSAVTLTPLNDQWKKMRRILASSILSPATHQWMHAKRAEEADHLVRHVYNVMKSEGGVVNIRAIAQHYCGNVIRKMIFGKRFFGNGDINGGPGVKDVEHVAALFNVLKYTYSFCISDYIPFLRYRLDLDGHEKLVRDANDSVRKHQDPEINSRIKEWKEGTRCVIEDLLDMLITLKDDEGNNLLAPEEIKSLILEITVATVDNPSNAVEWALDEKLNQPDIFVKALQELDQVVGKDRLVQESDMSNLHYIKACIKESFRIHPFAPFNLPHVSTRDTTVAGYFIPKGSHVLLSRPGLGRNPRIWDDPLLFKPERHLKDDKSQVILNDPDLRIFSFSIGRRGCAGVNLGTTVSVMLLARLLQAFTWSPSPNAPYIKSVEGACEMLPSKPLHAFALPRLDEGMYDALLEE
ncbi:valine N-monooxygenase 1-like [Impatiens glandulifera]|uniref:valine N-monooxygenase 1-like n=1 Tax=Impatiens glandulifera TaxID=253017 RepID=UPI001FB0705C|nr:valine N-monooxygenase 1-like [Impatiens glandulifera]